MINTGIAKCAILLAFTFVGWAICGAIMGIGRTVTSLENALVIHAIGAPIVFGALSLIYHVRFHFTAPLQTALVFTIFVMSMDFILVATFLEKSYAMFGSLLGTWIPFGLIFLSTLVVGLYVEKLPAQSAMQGSDSIGV